MSSRLGAIWLVVGWILCGWNAVAAWAQCGCGMNCNSGCQCGCNDPEKLEPPTDSGGPFDAWNVNLLSQLTLADLGAEAGVLGNDCWGWTDPVSGREFAIMGLTNATTFIEVTNPSAPVYLGKLYGHNSVNQAWRDIKVYNNRAYIVADGGANGSHGIQVFDLTRLLNVASPPELFTADGRYTPTGRAHNIAINEDTGFAYACGSPNQISSGGPIMLDLKNGLLPTWSGSYSGDGYTHDLQVVVYHGPDNRVTQPHRAPYKSYIGREIAFCCNEDTLTIVDVNVKGKPRLVSRTPYVGSSYSHQGWLTEDHRYFLLDDELDEQNSPTLIPTKTRVWDVRDLDHPVYLGHIDGTATTIDHNQYIRGNYIFQANYTSGLRIREIRNIDPSTNPPTLDIPAVGHFDTYEPNNNVTFNGAWSTYPFFPSENILISDRQGGLFVVEFIPPASESKLTANGSGK